MLSLSAKIRKDIGKKTKTLRQKGVLPGILYGPKVKDPLILEVDYKDFEKIYAETGESSLISLQVDKKKFIVLIHDTKRDPLTYDFIHADFYQPPLEKEVEATVPLIFEGSAPAVKELGGTLVKNISEVEVKAFPEKLPKEIKVNVDGLKTLEDHILIKDLFLPEGVKVLKDQEEVIVSITEPEKVEEELEKPIEEKVEEVEKAEKPEKEKEPEKEEEKND